MHSVKNRSEFIRFNPLSSVNWIEIELGVAWTWIRPWIRKNDFF